MKFIKTISIRESTLQKNQQEGNFLPQLRSETIPFLFKTSAVSHRVHKNNLEEQFLPKGSFGSDSLNLIWTRRWTKDMCSDFKKLNLSRVLLNFSLKNKSILKSLNQSEIRKFILTKSRLWQTYVGITNQLKIPKYSQKLYSQDPHLISTITTRSEYSLRSNLSTNPKVNAKPETTKFFSTSDNNFFFNFCLFLD